MTSIKQVTANRQNAKKSVGPRTRHGKLRSRQNALKHGLTAVTVVALIENAQEYEAWENMLITEYGPRTILEHAVVSRLASLLWRLKRAAAIEAGLFEAQADAIIARKSGGGRAAVEDFGLKDSPDGLTQTSDLSADSGQWQHTSRPTISECFFRLLTQQGDPLERVGRYEAGLWRQAAHAIALLNAYGFDRLRPIEQKNWRS